MRIGILGTGVVGRELADGFVRIGHEVTVGTRDVASLLGRTEVDRMGTPPFAAWHAAHDGVSLGTFAEVGASAELLVNATHGTASVDALTAAGATGGADRVLIDASNPLDFSGGFPPSLWVGDTDSLGEQIQRAFPDLRVVKTWNMMTAALMANPAAVAGGDHTIFLCGNDEDAKSDVGAILADFGWKDVLDLGDITNARAMEAYVTLWVRALGVLGTPMFNVKVVR